MHRLAPPQPHPLAPLTPTGDFRVLFPTSAAVPGVAVPGVAAAFRLGQESTRWAMVPVSRFGTGPVGGQGTVDCPPTAK